MKNLLRIIVCVSLMIYVAACKTASPVSHASSGDALSKNEIITRGIIQKQGITTYQYGTHVLKDTVGNTLYAVISDSVNLDMFIDKKITVIAKKMEGYPISGGPIYLEVIKIKE